jgi:D-amino-acid oxidase
VRLTPPVGPVIRILGGGVSGVTTGIVLRLLGHPVTIVAERVMTPDDVDDPRAGDPTFASMFPAASIIPNLAVDHDDWQAATALRFFGALRQVPGTGVRTQRHHDLFEEPAPTPAWARRLDRLEEFTGGPTGGTSSHRVPRRTGCEQVWGWSYDCLFAEMPPYRRWLLGLYAAVGGTFDTPRRLVPEDLARFAEPVIVNCTGFGSGELFDTRPDLTLVKGILVKVLMATSGDVRATPAVSYSYTPDRDVYARAGGHPANVYFSPRADCWLLGGTRLTGTIDDSGR